MKIKLIILLMALGLGARAQYVNVGANGVQRQIVAGDSTFRWNLGTAGFLYGKSLSWYRANFSPNLTFNNGLTRTANNVQLGGSYSSAIQIGNGTTQGSLYLNPTTGFNGMSSAYGSFGILPSVASFAYTGTSGGTVALQLFRDSEALFEDSRFNKGLSYQANYSANFTARSLIDKGYADGAYSPTTGGSGYIWNQETVEQNASFWVKGSAKFTKNALVPNQTTEISAYGVTSGNSSSDKYISFQSDLGDLAFQNSGFTSRLASNILTNNRNITLPDSSGTLAHFSTLGKFYIPTVNTDATPTQLATIDAGTGEFKKVAYSSVTDSILLSANRNNQAKYLKKVIAGDSVIINMFGTSLTYSMLTGGPVAPANGASQNRAAYQTYTALQQTLILAGIKARVNNRAYPGDGVAEGLTRWSAVPSTDVAIIEYATNDALNYGGHGVVPIDVFRSRMVQMIKLRLSQGSWVFLTLPTDVTDPTKTTLLNKYKSVVMELSDVYNCPIIDVQQTVEWIGNSIYSDEVHLTALAYNEWGSQAAALLIKPIGGIPIVNAGNSFNPRSHILDMATTVNSLATSGRVWSVTSSATFTTPLTVNNKSRLSTTGIGTSTYYVQYGNGLNQKTDTVTVSGTSPTYSRGGIILNTGNRVIFIKGSGSTSYIDQINFEREDVYSNTNRLTIGAYPLTDKTIVSIRDTTKITSGDDYASFNHLTVVNPTAQSFQRTIGVQVQQTKLGSFEQVSPIIGNTSIFINSGSGVVRNAYGHSSFGASVSSGVVNNYYHNFAFTPNIGTDGKIANIFGSFVSPQKSSKTLKSYGFVAYGTEDKNLFRGTLQIGDLDTADSATFPLEIRKTTPTSGSVLLGRFGVSTGNNLNISATASAGAITQLDLYSGGATPVPIVIGQSLKLFPTGFTQTIGNLQVTGNASVGTSNVNGTDITLANSSTGGKSWIIRSTGVSASGGAGKLRFDVSPAAGSGKMTLDSLGVLNLFSLTANTMLKSDASKNVVSAVAGTDYVSPTTGAATYGTKARITASGTGIATTITYAHGLSGVTSSSWVSATANNAASAGISYVTVDATNVSIIYTVAPAAGTNNLIYSVEVKP